MTFDPSEKAWFEPDQAAGIPSPALLVYPSRIEENIRRMIALAGSAERLRPHVKTHKMSAIVTLKLKHNINKFKCSTLAEAEMVTRSGGADVMLAMQPTGPQISLLLKLQRKYPASRISVIADHEDIIRQLSLQAVQNEQHLGVWLDINNGMNRTGVIPARAGRLYRMICESPFIIPRGLHVYDGHIHAENIGERKSITESDFEPVNKVKASLAKAGFPVPAIVAGGTPTFPVHAANPDVETSPGTLVLWDAGYGEHFPDLDFLHAAVLLTRVVSIPDHDLLCLDLGHKSIAAEMKPPRVRLLGLEKYDFVIHSEEHLVIKTADAERFKPGDIIYGIPWHICPTVTRYPFAYAIRDNVVEGKWKIDARDREVPDLF